MKMKILCLYNNSCALELFDWLKEQGHDTVLFTEKLSAEWCAAQHFDLTVSYTYRYILSDEILDALNRNAVNIHNAYLPWNRGADPNIWSILENTPRGVTLHYMNAGLDQGSIISQQLIADLDEEETLEATYKRLDETAKKLFKDSFAYYDFWQEMRKESSAAGSYHRLADLDGIRNVIGSYSIKISEFRIKYADLLANRELGGT